MEDEAAQHARDWDWFTGSWRVTHRRLKARLKGCSDWETFEGEGRVWQTLDGLGNVDDNVIHLPSGSYRAMTVRAYDKQAQHWSIWWLDGRNASVLDPPVHGRFSGDEGIFLGRHMLDGVAILVRFMWSKIHSGAPVWEQAFSADDGRTWETNWIMTFERHRAA